ncbi:hypothetical protein AB0L25_35785 [Spirillospora sp. NPDC052242]
MKPVPSNSPIQDQITWYWDQHAPAYQQFQEQRLAHPDYNAAWTRVWQDAFPDDIDTVLDVGTGTGHAALTIAAWQERIVAAGFADVEVTPLTELYELDGVHGVATNYRRTLQHLITARSPQPEPSPAQGS